MQTSNAYTGLKLRIPLQKSNTINCSFLPKKQSKHSKKVQKVEAIFLEQFIRKSLMIERTNTSFISVLTFPHFVLTCGTLILMHAFESFNAASVHLEKSHR